MQFQTQVEEVLIRVKGVKSFRFKRPPEFVYDPGQWIFVTIRADGEEKTRHFSLSSCPTEEDYIEFTKRITDHPFSMALDALRPGDWAAVEGPHGRFTFSGQHPRVGMITGGIGITPMMSMIRYCTDRGLTSRITLLYGSRSEENIIFRGELAELERRNALLKVVHCLSRPDDAWEGRRGHVSSEAIEEEIPDYRERIFYVSGPPSLVADLSGALRMLGIPQDRIQREVFPGY